MKRTSWKICFSIAVFMAIPFANSRICLSAPSENPLSLQPLQIRPQKSDEFIKPSEILLETIRGGRHEGYNSIVFEFSKKVTFEAPVIKGRELRLHLQNVTTSLAPFRRYKTFDAWVRLKSEKDGLAACIGLPDPYVKVNTLQLDNPDRVVFNIYHTSPSGLSTARPKPPELKVLPPVTSAPPVAPTQQCSVHPESVRAVDTRDEQATATRDRTEAETDDLMNHAQKPNAPVAPATTGVPENGQNAGMGAAGGGVTASSQRYRVKITPKISFKGEYDDNIYLENTNKKADFITTISPGILLNIESSRTGLELAYDFGWVRYNDFSENDFIRQSGRLKFWQRLTRHLKLNVTDTYLKSDDLFDENLPSDLGPRRVRHIRTPYQQNNFNASLDYQLDRESRLTVGYRNGFLDNKDPGLEDVTEHSPYAGVTYWFTKKHGIKLDYEYRRFDYSLDEGYAPGRVDLDAHDVDVTYIHRFRRRTEIYIHAGFANRNFFGIPVNYQVYDADMGVKYSFSRSISLTLDMGYFDPKGIDIDPGLSYNARLEKRFKRGLVFVQARSGWDEGFMDVEPTAFTRYWGGDAGVEYEPVHNLRAYAGVGYRKNKYALDEYDNDDSYEGRCGVRYRFLRWFSLDLGYTHRRRISDDPYNQYQDNRIAVTFGASKPNPYVWGF